KSDLVFVPGPPQNADLIIDVLDGKRPNAIDHPIRAALAKTENGLAPVGVGWVDFAAWPGSKNTQIDTLLSRLDLRGLQRIEVREGFQDDALVRITRLVAPSPRQGLLALFDQPRFDKEALPPMPQGLTGFTVLSVDAAKAFDALMALVKLAGPAAEARVDSA